MSWSTPSKNISFRGERDTEPCGAHETIIFLYERLKLAEDFEPYSADHLEMENERESFTRLV